MSGSMIGGVDASIPLQAGRGVQQVNPLQQIGQYAQTQALINQNKLFPGQQQLQQQAIQSGATNLASLTTQKAYQSIAQLLALPPGQITHDAVTTALGSVEHNLGLPTHGVLNDIFATAPTGDGPAFDTKMRALLASRAQISPESAVAQVTPQTGPPISTGQATLPTTVNPAGLPNPGQINPTGSALPIYPSTDALMGQVTWEDGNGVRHYGTSAEYAAQRGIPGTSLGPAVPVQGSGGAPAGAAPSAFPAGYDGRLPQAQPAAGPTVASKPQQYGNLTLYGSPQGLTDTTGAAPGTAEVQGQSAQQYAADQRAAGTFASRVLPLRQSIDLLSNTDTGPGSQTLNQFRSFAVSMANQGLLPKDVTPDAIQQANFDELRKYMSNYITNLPFAGGSDARMAEAVSGNPNINLSTIANKDLAKVLVGMERFRQAQYLSFNQQHAANPAQAAGQYGPAAAQFATQYDPRAFAYDLMNPAERTKLYNSLATPEAKQRYRDSLKLAYGIPGLMQ